ncbi:MAG: AAA family ATPase, partial [Clostridia bacterium]|nr:AAA family ATPase [Clostridia bacterium]
YVKSRDILLEKLNLRRLSTLRERPYQAPFMEFIIGDGRDTSREALARKAAEIHFDRSLGKELDRIYAGSRRPESHGHPVHYIVETDSPDAAKSVVDTLLSALYLNGRLRSRRCTCLHMYLERPNPKSVLEALYKANDEGVMLVRFHPDEYDEDEFDKEPIENACRLLQEYRSRVLTVFWVPRGADLMESVIRDRLGGTRTVLLSEDRSNREEARCILRSMCAGNSVRPDANLYAALSEDELYYPDEIRGIFEDWYEKKIRRLVYPQYADLDREASEKDDVKENEEKNEDLSAMDRLEAMVGLSEVKSVIRKAVNFFKLKKACEAKGTSIPGVSMHMVFTGNPGTAKTSVARLFAEILKENGVLSEGHLVEVGRADLVAKYVGHTAKNVKEKFEMARGGVLFIDEAYSLVDDREGLFGDEAINTIVQEMENNREDLVVVLAGYPDEMEEFLERNPGMNSRIAFHVAFRDYTSGELTEIAKKIGKEKGLTISDGALARLEDLFRSAMRRPGFGNGRFVRNAMEECHMNLADRLSGADLDSLPRNS